MRIPGLKEGDNLGVLWVGDAYERCAVCGSHDGILVVCLRVNPSPDVIPPDAVE